MLTIQRIIVPVDLRQHTNELAEYALGIAGNLDAKPTFVHVVELFPTMAGYVETCPTCLTDAYEEIHGRAQNQMDELVAQRKSACPGCSGVVLEGEDAAETILDYARKEKADLIIIGTHGTKGIEHILLGSVAERVVKGASCPVLVFNPYKGERAAPNEKRGTNHLEKNLS